MDDLGHKLDHSGLATREPDKTLASLVALGYETREPIHDSLQFVDRVLFRSPTMPAVEVISSPVPASSRCDATQPQSIYHLCYRSQNLAVSMVAMKTAGQRMLRVAEPKPAVLFGDKRVSFSMVRGFGLIGIIETCE